MRDNFRDPDVTSVGKLVRQPWGGWNLNMYVRRSEGVKSELNSSGNKTTVNIVVTFCFSGHSVSS